MPNTVAPPTAAPLIRNAPRLVLVSTAMSAASTTGPPSRIARNTERRDHSMILELQAQDVVLAEELAREGAGLVCLDVDGVGMIVDEIANLVHVAFGENPSLVDQQDVRRHRFDFVQDMARHDDALARAA